MSSFETKKSDNLAIDAVKNETGENYSRGSSNVENLPGVEEEKSMGVKRKATGVES